MIQHGLLFIWIDLMTLGRKERNKTYTYLNTVWDGSTFKKPLNIDDSVGSYGTMESAHTLESNDATQKQHTLEKFVDRHTELKDADTREVFFDFVDQNFNWENKKGKE